MNRNARIVLFAILISCLASAQQADTRELESYLHAVTRPDASGRASALREFLTSWPRSSLRKDALLWLTWETRSTDRALSAGYAREVLSTDSSNVLATAMLLDAAPPKADKLYDQAHKAIGDLPSLRPPAGMGGGEFYVVQTQVTAILCAAVGEVMFERKDYDTARAYLRRAATLSPNDARYAYSLGLADLSGKEQNASEGYWYLARAVDLARGSAAAQQIDAFARQRYQDDGGRAGDWDRFLASAAAPNAAPHAAVPNSATPPAIAASAAPAAPQPRQPVVAAKPAPPLPRPSELPPAKVMDGAVGDPGLPGPDAAHRQPFRPGAPLSLGILIEASLADQHNRKNISNALGDMVRHLTADQKSEAFVLSFAKDVIFNEDLTGDYRALERAMEHIKPAEGAALIDAVTIAAFQLNRVSHEGNNRVLLVISDGRNLDSRMSPLNAGSQLATGAVRVYCIGVGALSDDGGRRLQTLASSTGGDATLIVDTSEFRDAARQMAAKFGVEFPN